MGTYNDLGLDTCNNIGLKGFICHPNMACVLQILSRGLTPLVTCRLAKGLLPLAFRTGDIKTITTGSLTCKI